MHWLIYESFLHVLIIKGNKKAVNKVPCFDHMNKCMAFQHSTYLPADYKGQPARCLIAIGKQQML